MLKARRSPAESTETRSRRKLRSGSRCASGPQRHNVTRSPPGRQGGVAMKAREFWLLFTPSLIVMGGLLVLPLFRTVQWSFEDVRYGVPGTFVGLDNFADALTDPRFHR